MNQRTIFRRIHIILAIPIIGYIYSPFDKIPTLTQLGMYSFL